MTPATPEALSEAVALRRDPFTRFDGPFLGPDVNGRLTAIVDGFLRQWTSDGKRWPNKDDDTDLIPLQTRPAVRKWKTAFLSAVTSTPTSMSGGPSVLMIEREPVDALVEALRLIETGRVISTLQAHDALAAWEAGL